MLIPVPFDATTSYGGGAIDGPAAILAASAQVDLHDEQFGAVFRRGIFMEKEDPKLRTAQPRGEEGGDAGDRGGRGRGRSEGEAGQGAGEGERCGRDRQRADAQAVQESARGGEGAGAGGRGSRNALRGDPGVRGVRRGQEGAVWHPAHRCPHGPARGVRGIHVVARIDHAQRADADPGGENAGAGRAAGRGEA